MNRDQAIRGVDQWTGTLVLARADPPLTGVPIPTPQLPSFALPPDETGTRVCRCTSLTAPPGVDVFALFADDWQRAGFRPRSWSSPEGPVLMAGDQAGFLFVLRRHAGQVELYVVSPRLSRAADAPFYVGLAVGALIGLVGPCFSLLVFTQVFGGRLAFAAFVPFVLLLGGGLLISPSTRRFGVGLLIGGAITGIVTAGVCATMLF